MDSDPVVILVAALLLEEEEEEIAQQTKKRRKQRASWVRPLFLEKDGFFFSFRSKLVAKDPELFLNFVRMTEDDFDFLLNRVTPLIEKQNTCMREAISADERLVMTLRFLSTGDSYGTLMYLFKRSRSSICKIIPEVCTAIYKMLKDEFLKVPSTEEEWNEISKDINDRWNFPNAIGALDGRYIDLIAPAQCGSEYFNYKRRYSIVLMALVDASHNFIYVDVGAKGRESDGGVFNRCALKKAIEDESLNLPKPKPLPGRLKDVPYVIVADDSFSLKPYLMIPYKFQNQSTEERVFNYRLSRLRRVSENVFGLLSARFRVVRKSIELSQQNAETVVLAVCVLHNFLNKQKRTTYAQANDFDQINANGTVTEGRWRQEVHESETMASINVPQNEGRSCDLAKQIREEFKEYFMNEITMSERVLDVGSCPDNLATLEDNGKEVKIIAIQGEERENADGLLDHKVRGKCDSYCREDEILEASNEIGNNNKKEDYSNSILCGEKASSTNLSSCMELNNTIGNLSDSNLEIPNKNALDLDPSELLGKYQCFRCPSNFAEKSDLSKHLIKHFDRSRPHMCHVCEKTYPSRSSLLIHINCSADIRPYQCEQCDKAFPTSSALAQHRRNNHSGITPIKCSKCDYTALVRQRIDTHMAVHMEERPFKCHYCSYAAAAQRYLTAHLRLHKDDKRYKCEICYFRFAEGTLLRKHRKKHFLKDVKSHQCMFCPIELGSRAALRYHVEHSHRAETLK